LGTKYIAISLIVIIAFFPLSQYKTIAFIQEHFFNFDDYLRHTVQELITENILEHDNFLKKFSGFKLA
jgi:hypothetical protein